MFPIIGWTRKSRNAPRNIVVLSSIPIVVVFPLYNKPDLVRDRACVVRMFTRPLGAPALQRKTRNAEEHQETRCRLRDVHSCERDRRVCNSTKP